MNKVAINTTVQFFSVKISFQLMYVHTRSIIGGSYGESMVCFVKNYQNILGLVDFYSLYTLPLNVFIPI